MCLQLKSSEAKVEIAKEDIVVYKALKHKYTQTINKLNEVKHGDSFKGIIRGVNCEGKISIRDIEVFYFCTNDMLLSGFHANDKLGYKYSWRLDNIVNKIIVNDEIMLNMVEIAGYETYYQEAEVEIGKTYTSDLIKCLDTVEDGLHSFENFSDANFEAMCCIWHKHIVVKCIIPKGSKYYKGLFGSYDSYVSNKLTYIEIIK